jgi:hypothetical protein
VKNRSAPPLSQLRVAAKTFTESPDVDGARATLRRYLKGGEITLTPERFEGRETTWLARSSCRSSS